MNKNFTFLIRFSKVLLLFLLLSNYSNAQILTFEFSALLGDEATASSNYNDANLTSSTVSRGSGVTTGLNSGRFNSLNWATTASIDANDYVQFTITPNSGYQFSVSSILIQHQRSGTGPVSFVLRSNLDGYSSNLGGIHTIADVTTTQTYTYTFAQTDQSVSVTYRIYAYSAEAGTGTWGPGDGTGNDIVVNGTVTPAGASLSATPTTLSGFLYSFGTGPSTSQSYSLSGTSLTPAAGNITVTAPTDYEISSDNTTFTTVLNFAYAGNALAATTVYVRLKSGLAIGSYNLENVVNSGGGATSVNVVCSGDVTGATTVFAPGDIAVLGVNSNLTCVGGYSPGDDEISFVCFKDITSGTSFYVTDNGYQYTNANKWGDTEGCYLITRTGGTITAGTVITFRFKNLGPNHLDYISPDANWTFIKIAGMTTGVVLNSGGDQLYFMQGGSWVDGGGSADAVYTPGTYLFAFNTNSSWTNFGGTSQHSGLIDGMECFSMMPGVATDFIKYTGPVTATSKRDWIDRINTTANWTAYAGVDVTAKCNNYNAGLPNYAGGYSIPISAGGFIPGIWTGARNIDWFNCGNWQNMEVPDRNTNVTVPGSATPFDPTIGNPPTVPIVYTGAECNDITVNTGHTLTMNHANSKLDVYDNIAFLGGSLVTTNGIVNIYDDNSTLSASAPLTFYNLTINKTTTANTFTIGNIISINNVLTLTKGIVITGANRVTVSNSALASVTGHGLNSYINGNLRRNVLATGTYDFPVGTATNYELAQIIFNSSSGLGYIDASFTNPHSTPLNISALSLMIGSSLLEELLDYGYWTLTPDAGTYNYDVLLTSRGHTNPGATANVHAVIKRPNSASSWVSQGTHNNADQAMGAGWVTGVRRQLTVFSDFAIAKSLIGPLPVELLSFNATRDGQDVFLKWVTASEINNDFFTVERSSDGESFEIIGIISGSGNSNNVLEYSMHDINPLSGINYYRLKQTDFDGKFSYSNVVSVSTEKNQGEAQFIANSVTSELELYLNLLTEDKISINIYDLSGKKMFTESIYSESGLRSFHLKLPAMSKGLYFGEVIGKNLTVKQKFIY
ncbi:MAG: T9SS type A sorting domain-containing protein [Bacteroidota bacterium]